MKRTVQDVMTREVVAVRESASFKDIVRTMREHRVSAVPVLDDAGALLGIISEADLLLKEELAEAERGGRALAGRHRRTERRKAAGLKARDLMSTPVVTAGLDMTLAEAARLMHAKRVKRVPVVTSGGQVAGIVSRGDLLSVFLRPDAEIRTEVERDVILRTLWIEPYAVRVKVSEGVVTLEGQVERQSLRELLVRLVSDLDGVIDVIDRLSVEFDDTPLLRPSMFEPWTIVPPSGATSAALERRN